MARQEVILPLAPAALLEHCSGEPYVFALDGSGTGSWGCGCALLGFRPRARLRVAADGVAVISDGEDQRRWRGDPFMLLDEFRAAYAPAAHDPAESFASGLVVALSYDLRLWVERLQARAPDTLGLPLLHAAFYEWVLRYDYAERRYWLASATYSAAALRGVAARLEELAARPLRNRNGAEATVRPTIDRQAYRRATRAVLDYIAAGDVYQVNLAQRFVVPDPPQPVQLYAALQRRHPMPFAAYVDAGEFVLVSNSPECFLSVHDGAAATFPIKGTRRRDANAQLDARLIRELRGDPKERAEHVMIVDLERNDLGRVCRIGSVHVDEFAEVHSFPSLHHMISAIAGELRPDVALADILRATFPGGSITGAPKIRAMQIIDELEPVRRNFYTGAIGFIGIDGRSVFNLAIRTAVAAGGQITYHAGGGIVADSNPDREYEETLLKARPFFDALGAYPS